MKILFITLITLLALSNSVVDTTTIVRIYKVDNLQYVDFERDNHYYVGVYVEDL